MDYRISPDGKRLAWLEYHKGYFKLFTKIIGKKDAAIIETGCWCHIDWYEWAKDSRHLVYRLDTEGKGWGHLYLADAENPLQASVNLTPNAQTRASLYRICGANSQKVLLSQNSRCRHCFDLHEVNPATGEDRVIARSEKDVLQWIVDEDGALRGRIRTIDAYKNQLDICDQTTTKWRKALQWNCHEEVRFLSFTEDANTLWLLSNRKRDRIGLVRFDLRSFAETLVYEDPEVDVASVFIGPKSHQPEIAFSWPNYPRTHPLNPKIIQDLEQLKTDDHTGISILSMDDTETIWTVSAFDDRGSDWYLYHQDTHEKTLLGSNRRQDKSLPFSNVTPVVIPSKDGLSLRGYLTLPQGAPPKKLPMVLLVHGGPWSRDYWRYDDIVQFLANRGYAVLQLNFRGSDGYGIQFRNAAIGEFAAKMHDDLLDGVHWAVTEGYADPDAVAIVGASYGGYAALVGLAFTPTVFACGISINGLSDVGAFMESLESAPPLYQKQGIAMWHLFIGNPKSAAGKALFAEKSPLTAAKRIEKPVLIIYGDKDGRVDPEHSERMISELKRLDKPVESLRLENEGHGISRTRHNIQMFKKMETFLARHMGGRCL